MGPIKTPHKKSREVLEFATIAQDARAMSRLLMTYTSPGGLGPKQHYAIHHSQFSKDPYNFFVVNPLLFGEGGRDVMVVVNPKIIKKFPETRKKVKEACMSFPLRRAVEVSRYDQIEVVYQVPTPDGKGMITKQEVIEGFMAQIFQHEIQHGNGGHIYIGSKVY
jgi:hypothetical protein